MSWTDLEFTPTTGLQDSATFPSKPPSGTGSNSARGQVMNIINQIKTFINGTVKTEIAAATPKFKIGKFTRDLTTAAGTQTITGVGFTPKSITFYAVVANTPRISNGFDDGTNHYCEVYNLTTWSYEDARSIELIESSAPIISYAYVSEIGSDGFTLTWVKSGSPSGIAMVFYKAEG